MNDGRKTRTSSVFRATETPRCDWLALHGDDGKGVSIGFDLRALYVSLGLLPVRMEYDCCAFLLRCIEAFPALCGLCRDYEAVFPLHVRAVSSLGTILSCVALQLKSDDWAAEKELRLMQWNIPNDPSRMRNRTHLAFHIDPRECIREIVIGSRVSAVDTHRLLTVLQRFDLAALTAKSSCHG